jgi:hypothetical protein
MTQEKPPGCGKPVLLRGQLLLLFCKHTICNMDESIQNLDTTMDESIQYAIFISREILLKMVKI